MAQEQISKGDSEVQKSPVEKKKEKDHTPSKVVIRRLPPTLTPEDFVQQVAPLPEYDFFYFVRADMSLGANAFTRAYINFLVPDDIFIFRDKFDGYVFLDSKGGEYPALVEFAPFQKVPKKKPKKVDAKNGIIEQDSDYKKFLENLSKPTEAPPVSLDAMVVEVEAKENIITKSGLSKMSTPLLDYLRKRREERKLNIAKLKEERRRGAGGGGRDRDDRKRPGKDDLDRRKSSDKDRVRDRDRDRHRDRNRERDRLRERDRRRDKDSHRSERNKEEKDEDRKWHKDSDRMPKTVLRNTERDSQNLDKGGPEKSILQEREKRDNEKDGAQDRLSEADPRKGTLERKSDDTRGKRGFGSGGGKWGDDRRREDDREKRGSRGRGLGSDDGGKPYKEGRVYQGYRDDLDSRLQDKDKNRGGGDRYEKAGDRYEKERGNDRYDKEKGNDRYDKEKGNDRYDKEKGNDRYDKEKGNDRYDKEKGNDRYDKERGNDRYDKERGGYNNKFRDDRYNYRDKYRDDRVGTGRYRDEKRGGGGDRDKDDRRGGGEREERKGKVDRDERRNDRDDRRVGGGDGWKKKDIEIRKFEKSQEKRIDISKNKTGLDGKKESNQTSKEVQPQDAAKEDRIKEEKSGQKESSDGKAGCVKGQEDSHSQRSTPDPKEDYDGRGDNTDPDDKKRKRKDRPERQIYIPRKALERQRQGSPQTGETPRDKPKETS